MGRDGGVKLGSEFFSDDLAVGAATDCLALTEGGIEAAMGRMGCARGGSGFFDDD
jgi:hypothetical protein